MPADEPSTLDDGRSAEAPAAAVRLIVNADDFGQSHGINAGVSRAHREGIVTSASLMVRWEAAVEAAHYARGHPDLSAGLHVDLGEWTYGPDGWYPEYLVVPEGDPAAVRLEVERQLDAFRHLVGADPSHLDSHQHAHRSEPLASILSGIAAHLGVPLRDVTPAVSYRGDFYGQSGKGYPVPEAISVEALLGILAALPPGLTELGCHPGVGSEVRSMYGAERALELETLCNSRVQHAVRSRGIELCSFRDPKVEGIRAG
jgi:chitin disaccharide deacetylase